MKDYDVELERDVLAQALRDASFTSSATVVLAGRSFSSKTSATIWKILSENHARTGELPSPLHWAEELEAHFKRAEDFELAARSLVELRRRKVPSPKSSLERLRDLVRTAAMRRAAGAALEGIEDGDLEAADAALHEGLEAARAASILEEEVDWSAWEERLAKFTSPGAKKVKIRTPLPTFDRITNGGVNSGTVNLVVALTNVGKSTFAVDIGWNALTKSPGAIVIHVATEETIGELSTRYDARLTGISRERIGPGMTAADADTFRSRFKKMGHIVERLHIRELPPQSKASALRVYVQRIREANPKAEIVLVVDSADHLSPPGKVESHRLGASAVYWGLKAIAVDSRLAPVTVWSTTQAPKAFEGKSLTSAAVAESYDKARIADTMLGMMEGDADEEAGTKSLRFVVMKNRLGSVKHFTIYVDAHLATGEFHETASEASSGDE